MQVLRGKADWLAGRLVQLGTTAPPEIAQLVWVDWRIDQSTDWLVQLGTTAPPEVAQLVWVDWRIGQSTDRLVQLGTTAPLRLLS